MQSLDTCHLAAISLIRSWCGELCVYVCVWGRVCVCVCVLAEADQVGVCFRGEAGVSSK